MKFSDSAQDAARPGPGAGVRPGTADGDGDAEQARSLWVQEPLQAIQDIIDKLAAVTRQLRSPRPGPGSVPGPTR
jgi:hypothetical protein